MASCGEEAAYFEAGRSAEIVNGRVGPHTDPRLRAIMEVVVRQLHAATREAAITMGLCAGAAGQALRMEGREPLAY